MKKLNIPNLEKAFTVGLDVLDERERDRDWNPKAIHASDLAVILPQDEGGKCSRQLWLRTHEAEGNDPSDGQRLMWDHGRRIERRVAEALVAGFATMPETEQWDVVATNLDVSGRGMDAELDVKIVGPEGEVVIIDVKSVRGNAFKQALPRESNEIQLQVYMKRENADLGILFYVDREGQNHVKACFVTRDDERINDALRLAKEVRALDDPPPVLKPNVTIRENKGPDAVYVSMPWQCDYCPYLGKSCSGALPPELRFDTVVAYRNEDGEVEPRLSSETNDDGNLTPEAIEHNNRVRRLLSRAFHEDSIRGEQDA